MHIRTEHILGRTILHITQGNVILMAKVTPGNERQDLIAEAEELDRKVVRMTRHAKIYREAAECYAPEKETPQ